MAILDKYCDYAAGDDSTGDGSVGNPFKTVQTALNNLTGATEGGRVYIVPSADQVITANLTHTSFTRSASNPLILTTAPGYSPTQAVLSGSTTTIFNNAYSSVYVYDLTFTTTYSTSSPVSISEGIFHGCVFNINSNANISSAVGMPFSDCVFNFAGTGYLNVGSQGYVRRCAFFKSTGNQQVLTPGNYAQIMDCLFVDNRTSGSTALVYASSGQDMTVQRCTIYNNGSGITAPGIDLFNTSRARVYNCLIEGYTSNHAIRFAMTTNNLAFGNSWYNCLYGIGNGGSTWYGRYMDDMAASNETLGATPFEKVGTPTFADRLTFFKPVNTGQVFQAA